MSMSMSMSLLLSLSLSLLLVVVRFLLLFVSWDLFASHVVVVVAAKYKHCKNNHMVVWHSDGDLFWVSYQHSYQEKIQ